LEIAEIHQKVSEAGKKLEAQVLELAELHRQNSSAEWKADNREAMCVGFEKKILGLESAKDQLESDTVLLKEKNLALVESEKGLQSKLGYKDQLLDQDLEIIQGLEGELEDFKKLEKTALENADATEKAKESLFQKNESLKGFQTDLEVKILSLEAQKSKILKENQNLDQKIETLANANSDLTQKLQKVEFELVQSQENFKTDRTQATEFFEAQINGQKSINQDLLNLFDSEKKKNERINSENSDLKAQISDLAATMTCSQKLAAQGSVNLKSFHQENSDKESLWEKERKLLESQIFDLRTTLEETNNVLEILEEGFRESERQIKQMGGTPVGQKQVNIILKERSNRSLLLLGQNSK
jgi:chromosome segregation ATPase